MSEPKPGPGGAAEEGTALREENRALREELAQARERLAELTVSERQARGVLACSLDILVVTDRERHIIEFNPAAERALGYRREEVLGRRVDFIFADSGQGEALQRTALRGDSLVDEILGRRKDGTTFTCLAAVSAVRDEAGEFLGVVGTARDISTRKAAERELTRANHELRDLHDILRFSRNKLKAAFDAIRDPVYTVTRGQEIESVNLAAAGLAGRHPRQLVGLGHEAFLAEIGASPQLAAACRQGVGEVQAGGRGLARLVESPAPGEARFHEIILTPIFDEAGELVLVLNQLKDITAQKRMELTIREYSTSLERKVAERTAELSRANQELLALDQLRRDLTNMVVHDMKGPLAELVGNLDLLSYEPLSPSQREVLDLAVLGAGDLERMIRNLLDINRLEEGHLKIAPAPVVFGRVVAELQKRFATLIRLKGLTVGCEDAFARPFPADPDLFARVLQNLLTNAIQHTEEGGSIAFTAAAAPGGGGVRVAVADTGCGIAPEYHDRLFKKFSQADAGDAPRTSTGLGLYFCAMVAKAHGGRIWFESQPGKGTTFFLDLPVPA